MEPDNSPLEQICRICGNSFDNQIYHVKEMMYGTGEVFDYFQCGRCSCLQISKTPENMAPYYPSNYYSLTDNSRSSSLKRFLKKKVAEHRMQRRNLMGAIFSKYVTDYYRYEILQKYGFSFDSAFLDVGCGSGKGLFEMARDGFTNLTGIDPFTQNEIHKDSIRILKTDLTEFVNSGRQYDIILFNHTLEHMPEQHKMLTAAKNLSAPGGVIIVAVPTVSSRAWEQYRTDWVQIDAPRHFFLHSRKSMELLAASAELSISEMVYDSNEFQFWGSEQYKKNIPLTSRESFLNSPANSCFSNRDMKKFRKMSVDLNRQDCGDRAFWILQK